MDVPVIENAFVCNGQSPRSHIGLPTDSITRAVGDMLDMITGGRLKSTFHRVVPPPRLVSFTRSQQECFSDTIFTVGLTASLSLSSSTSHGQPR